MLSIKDVTTLSAALDMVPLNLSLTPSFLAAGQYKPGQEEIVFSPTAAQAKDRYAQNYMNSVNQRRSGSREPGPNE